MNKFEKQIAKIKLPEIHISDGKEYIFDPIRETLIYKTPEEVVRQQIITYMVKKMKVPKNMIEVEMPLLKYHIESRQRTDILIERYSEEEDVIYPLAVIECKAPDIMLLDSAIEQGRDYAYKLGAEYIIITNGHELIVEKYDEEGDIIELSSIPSYQEMLEGNGSILEDEQIEERLLFHELVENQCRYSGENFSENTPRKFLPFLTNLFECFVDTSRKMPRREYKNFTLLKDYGLRGLRCGTPGGHYQGTYRSLLIKYGDKTKFINLSFFSYGTHTILTVSIQQENNRHHNALQYSIDENLIKEEDDFHFFHSGKITIGELGARKASELKAFISKRYPSLIVDDKIYLGTLKNKKLLYMNTPSVVKFVENCILYAIARDEFREIVKRKAKLGEKIE